MTTPNLPTFTNYGEYSSNNYGAHSLMFTDPHGNRFYYSYHTLVAFETPKTGRVVIRNAWGTTTGKHLNWIDGGNKKARVTSEEFARLFAQAFPN